MITGGGSALVHSDVVVTPFEGIRGRCGHDIDVRFSPGTAGTGMLPAIPAAALQARSGEHGWDAEYYAGPDLGGDPLTALEPMIDEELSRGPTCQACGPPDGSRRSPPAPPESTGSPSTFPGKRCCGSGTCDRSRTTAAT